MSAVYVHETVDVVPGKIEAYIEALETIFLPLVTEKLQVRLLGCWELVGSTGGRWEQVVLWWELDDWEHFARFRGRTYDRYRGRDPLIHQWRNEIAVHYRAGGASRLLVPVGPMPLLASLTPRLADGTLKAGVAQQDLTQVAPGKMLAWAERERTATAARRAEHGYELIGVLREVTRSDSGISLWTCVDYPTWTHAQHSRYDARGADAWDLGNDGLSLKLESNLLTPAPPSGLK
jgi:hypothetical protein